MVLQANGQSASRGLRRWLSKAANLVVLGLLCSWFYEWGSTRFYQPDHTAGFRIGILHGALMPMALPGLLLGKNPEIYATLNTGRSYKIGYITGINLCGLVFFGLAFWSPKRPDSPPNG